MFTKNIHKLIRCFIVIAIIFLGMEMVYIHYEWSENAKIVPPVSRGDVVTFSAEMRDSAQISEIDASKQYIYIAYSEHGVVAVYDMCGEYQYSLAFFQNTNGGMLMRCEDGLLYVSDYANYEFVFLSNELIQVLSPLEEGHSMAWFNEAKDVPIVVKNDRIYDKHGNFIMELPGRLQVREWFERTGDGSLS